MLTAFNWKNYKNSPEAIQFRKKAKVDPSIFMLTEFEIDKEKVKNLKKLRIESINDADEFVLEFALLFLKKNDEDEVSDFINEITDRSLEFFLAHPKYFFPYSFRWRFDIFKEIIETNTGIELPEVPHKVDLTGRFRYYFTLNSLLQNFARKNDMDEYDLICFVYHYCLNNYQNNTSRELPSPSGVRFLMAAAVDIETLNDIEDIPPVWGARPNMRRGDIFLMYEPSPIKGIRTIFRAESEPFKDPFTWWYYTIRLCEPLRCKLISRDEMKETQQLSQLISDVRFLASREITLEAYNEFLSIYKKNNPKGKPLPLLKGSRSGYKGILKNEKDVETKILEPFLKEISYSEDDWTRQAVIKVGIKERGIPDYVFGLKKNKAKMIIEAKHHVLTHDSEIKAFEQAQSYAKLLDSDIIVIVSEKKINVYQKKQNAFTSDNKVTFTWKDMEDIELFNKCKRLIGKTAVLG